MLSGVAASQGGGGARSRGGDTHNQTWNADPFGPEKSPASVPGRGYAAGQRDAPGLGGKKGAPDKRTRSAADCSPSSRPAVGGGGDVAALFGCEAICASLTADPSAPARRRRGLCPVLLAAARGRLLRLWRHRPCVSSIRLGRAGVWKFLVIPCSGGGGQISTWPCQRLRRLHAGSRMIVASE